ncbi:hypothetical protein F5Y00DRAFT_876 [Daldinia vernicosa]|uniref:uncharacterized protein n=1 Tax=Daldinia vernicosa TaxID=114800 RepID=UPI0020087737|nr:uncharacterized protein F5Y00DRAFT_876 [Daldinia vernicosa]KAI0854093.1 hypothetical protein F5Y00DRAFT_876 [Daldinia vernicosa]
MFEELLETCKKLKGSQTSLREIREDILQLVPNGCTAQDLKNFLSASKDELDHVAVLLAAYAATLKISKDAEGRQDRIDQDNNLDDTLRDVADVISSLILPIRSCDSLDEDETDYSALQRKGELGLLALDALTKTPSKPAPLQLPHPVLLRVTAFTNAADPWTTAESRSLSHSLLEAQLQQLGDSQTRAFIAEDILTSFLRPLFSKSRPAAITASGRKAEFVEPSRYDGASRESPETKPWKYAHRYAVTVFAWAVERADSTLLQAHWPLFTPVLLTLIDEPGPSAFKVRALGILRAFWARCPAGLMRDTGLGEVFEQAVFPAVLYLPSLTPEDESLDILGAAYPVLIEMAGLAVDRPLVTAGAITAQEQQTQKSTHQITEAQRRLLDKIIREGIMIGYHHAKEHVRLVGLFCETLVCIINGMGILAVKHLKDFIPMLSEVMIDPFGTKHPPTLSSATNLLQAILRNCWPRIQHYCNEVIKMIMLCWLNIEDEESLPPNSPIANDLKSRLTQTANMLSAIMKAAQIDFRQRVDPLIEKEPQLKELFGGMNS